MKKTLIAAIVFMLMAGITRSQQIFIDQVSVDYTKTVYYWPLAKEMFPEWFEGEKDHMPKEIISVFNFTGDNTKSIYQRIKEPERKPGMWIPPLGDENIVYNNYETGMTTTQKPVYEENFLVQDSMLNIKWKITPDTRIIAGFNCRKAVGFLFDTVAVFAFYTDEILVNGGPEGIHGLPGLILGMGIPRLHMTWFANNIKIADVAAMKKVTPATKGKKTNRADLLTALTKAMKNWDQYGQKLLLAFLI